jgi:hypothetical protein
VSAATLVVSWVLYQRTFESAKVRLHCGCQIGGGCGVQMLTLGKVSARRYIVVVLVHRVQSTGILLPFSFSGLEKCKASLGLRALINAFAQTRETAIRSILCIHAFQAMLFRR